MAPSKDHVQKPGAHHSPLHTTVTLLGTAASLFQSETISYLADSIIVLQQQLQRVQELKSGYSQLHKRFSQHVSSLTREQQLEPPQKRAKAQQAAALDTGHQDMPASTGVQEPPDTAPPILSPHPSTEGPSSEETRRELLKALKHRLEDLPSIARLEQSAASCVALDQDRLDACAVLTGRKTRYYVHQTTISVGRTSVHRGQVCYPETTRQLLMYFWLAGAVAQASCLSIQGRQEITCRAGRHRSYSGGSGHKTV